LPVKGVIVSLQKVFDRIAQYLALTEEGQMTAIVGQRQGFGMEAFGEGLKDPRVVS
jgi:hypothetical protein